MTKPELEKLFPRTLMPFQWDPFNGDHYVNAKFLELRDRFGITTAYELGACLGSTTEWLGMNFDNVLSCEINPMFAAVARSRCNVLATIDITDSLEFIQKRYRPYYSTPLVFIDSHWDKHCPLYDELRYMGSMQKWESYRPPVIVIHDFQTGNPALGYDQYPGVDFTLAGIEKYLSNIYPKGYDYEYNTAAAGAKRGIIYITPKQ